MLSYKEYDNAQAVEIVLSGRVSTEEFDKVARKLEAFIERHGEIRVLEVIKDFEGMDAGAFWHDVQFSLRHVQDFSRIAIVTNPDVLHLWSSLVAPFMRYDVEHFSPGEMEAARDWLMWPEGAVLLPGRFRRRLFLNRIEILDDRFDVRRAEHEDR